MAFTKFYRACIGILLSCVAGVIILQLQGYPAGKSFQAMMQYSVFLPGAFFNSLARFALLLLTGLSAVIGFRAGAINLGQPGQLLVGAMAVTICGLYIDAPSIFMIPLLLGAAVCAGALWAGISALFRIRFGMDEFLTTLMLNFIADDFTAYLVASPMRDTSRSTTMSLPIAAGGVLPQFGRFSTAVFVAMCVFLLVHLWQKYSLVGYEMRLMGENPVFTRTGGCNNPRNFITAMLASGAVAGIAGALMIMGGQQHRFISGMGIGYAWDGVMIAIVAANGAVATALYALFFAILQTGSLGMEIETHVPSEFILVFQACIVLFVVAADESLEIIIQRIAIWIKTHRGQPHTHTEGNNH